jgi:hypothetical protein
MAITVLPTRTDPSIGRTKKATPLSAGIPIDLDYQVTADEMERLKTAVIETAEAVGLGNGTTAGSLEARMLATDNRVLNIQALEDGDAITAEDVVLVDTTGGAVTLSVQAPAAGRSWLLKKTSAGTNSITLTPPTGWSIESAAANAPFVLPDSATAARYAWTIVAHPSQQKIWVM